MNNNENDKFYEILELSSDASFAEIKSAYYHLKKLYSSESAVLSPLMEEMSEEKRRQLVEQIQEAYDRLKEYHSSRETEKQKATRDRVLKKSIPEFEVFSGNALKLTREVLGVELQEIALGTGIPINHLRNIERERFDLLPPRGYVRIYVSRYAQYLALDAKQVTDDYMKVYGKKNKAGNTI